MTPKYTQKLSFYLDLTYSVLLKFIFSIHTIVIVMKNLREMYFTDVWGHSDVFCAPDPVFPWRRKW